MAQACVCSLTASCLLASAAHAHAPEPRGVALLPDLGAVSVALPGFGLLVRTTATAPFSYVCDALLNTAPSDLVTPMAYLTDGSLLLGTAAGVRIVDADGCPRTDAVSDLSDAAVFALAVSRGSPQVAYAATGGSRPGVWRSRDGGQHWELRSPLVSPQLVSALLVSPDSPDVVYLSQGIPQTRSTLRVSSDGGATFANHEQDRALTLLHVEAGTPTRLWVVGRDAQSVANRGFAISRGDGPAGPWVSKLRVNYFGGFAMDEHGAIAIGDESGGLFQSLDEGQTFTTVSADSAVSCLARVGDATWACNIGTPVQPALTRRADDAAPAANVVAFADVQQMVSCAPALDVERRCAQAWFEWQRDVLMRDLTAQDAGAARDAALASADAGPGVAGAPNASPATPADAAPNDATTAQARTHDGCSLATTDALFTARGGPVFWLFLVLSALTLRARRPRLGTPRP